MVTDEDGARITIQADANGILGLPVNNISHKLITSHQTIAKLPQKRNFCHDRDAAV
jgi:hypothetical protein